MDVSIRKESGQKSVVRSSVKIGTKDSSLELDELTVEKKDGHCHIEAPFI